jgi:hypothetical protein
MRIGDGKEKRHQCRGEFAAMHGHIDVMADRSAEVSSVHFTFPSAKKTLFVMLQWHLVRRSKSGAEPLKTGETLVC